MQVRAKSRQKKERPLLVLNFAVFMQVVSAQDEDITTKKMVKLLLAATEYTKFAAMMSKIAGGDTDACERRAAFFREN
jgi:hypothetical protein